MADNQQYQKTANKQTNISFSIRESNLVLGKMPVYFKYKSLLCES